MTGENNATEDEDLPPIVDEIPEEELEAEPDHSHLLTEDGEPEEDE